MQDIEKQLSNIYGINIESLHNYKNNCVAETQFGKKIIKRMSISPERILFIHGAKEHLYSNNFNNLDRYICTKEGNPYACIDGFYYTMTDLKNGRECNFDLREDVIKASKTLAGLHCASKGYVSPKESIKRSDLGKLPEYYKKRLNEIKRVKKLAQRERSKFDYLILKYIDYFYEIGKDSLNKIYTSKYNELVDKARKEKNFCHHDYSYCNIICDGEKMSIINFDYCSYELKVYDVANFLRRKMRKCYWNIEEAKTIIDSYTSIESISDNEFMILYIMLQFPHKFWRVINKYYNSRRTWREKKILIKYQEVIDEIEHHKNFLSEFKALFLSG
ncbi:CotS family spore coat protein [Herbivorax sp. ANBcel31]|uniref:CotS family spore coat protein n=1 Tax=Herbivorax sp. ANBcel31 TaxID=3069754 RepID=UPI0027ADF912|nr:CotS family spore coat protein [Herbivorax sp. ANBcel31]MDQ2086041.1 CotS family spore coat protein [Herbivorax sp. ANBcel31]